jgi:hypothetical protein
MLSEDLHTLTADVVVESDTIRIEVDVRALGADLQNVHARVRDGVLTISAPYGTRGAAPVDKHIDVLPSICACHPDAAAC